jgi:hypothetical protein
VALVDLLHVLEADGHFLAAVATKETIVADVGGSLQINDSIKCRRVFCPVGVEVIVDGVLDAVHEACEEAVAGKDALVRLHGALHEEELGVFAPARLALVTEARGKGVELKGVCPALRVLVKEGENVCVIGLLLVHHFQRQVFSGNRCLVFDALPLGHGLWGDLVRVVMLDGVEHG